MADLCQNKSKTESLRIGLPGGQSLVRPLGVLWSALGPPIGHMDAKSENRTIKLILIYFPVHFITGSLQKRMKLDSLEGEKKDYLQWVASFAYIGVNTNQAAAVSVVG